MLLKNNPSLKVWQKVDANEIRYIHITMPNVIVVFCLGSCVLEKRKIKSAATPCFSSVYVVVNIERLQRKNYKEKKQEENCMLNVDFFSLLSLMVERYNKSIWCKRSRYVSWWSISGPTKNPLLKIEWHMMGVPSIFSLQQKIKNFLMYLSFNLQSRNIYKIYTKELHKCIKRWIKSLPQKNSFECEILAFELKNPLLCGTHNQQHFCQKCHLSLGP